MQIVPSILIAILNTPYKDFSYQQVSSIRFIGCGSAFLPKNLQDVFEKSRIKAQLLTLPLFPLGYYLAGDRLGRVLNSHFCNLVND